jgi:putative serine protease PepD
VGPVAAPWPPAPDPFRAPAPGAAADPARTPPWPPVVSPPIPPAGGGFPPPLPGPSGWSGPPGPSGAPPFADAAEGGPSPRPLTTTKLVVLVGLVSAFVAALVTSGVFLAAGAGRDLTAGRAPGVTTDGSGRLGAKASLDIQALLAKARPSVVAIHTQAVTSRGVLGGAGTGVIISDDGLVLTNAHVVNGADLGQLRVTMPDGVEKTAELVGSLVDNDVALIRVKDARGLVPADLGSSTDVRVGDDVVAIGNALNLGGEPTVTEGIVSAKERVIEDNDGKRHGHLIQTDAAINPGNSGGPLLNAAGQVVGINTAVIGGSGEQSVQNIGFAIAIDEIKPLIEQIKAGKATVTPDQAFLGVQSRSVSEISPTERDGFDITATDGAVVEAVTRNSAADAAGLHAGDVITAIDGQPVTSKEDVGNLIRAKKPGDEITIDYERAGERRQATATLKARKDSGN